MKIIIWVIWIITAFGLHIFGNNAGTFVILTASVVIPVISWVIAAILSKRGNISLELPEKGVKNGEVTGYIKVSSNGFFTVKTSCIAVCENLLTGETISEKIYFNANNKSKFEFKFEASHCGIIRVTLKNPRFYDIFGLLSVKIKNQNTEKTIMIPPETFDINVRIMDNINAVSDSGEYSVTRSGSDNTEICAVREYIPGDPIKNIHWKLSEKTDKLMVRDFGSPAENKILILLEKSVLSDKIPPSASETDKMAELLSSISLKLSNENIRHDIVWRDMKSKTIKKRELDGETGIGLFYGEILQGVPKNENTSVISDFLALGERYEYSHTILISQNTPPDIDLLYSKTDKITIFNTDNINNGNNINDGLEI